MTFDARMFRPTRNPATKTVAAASTHTGHAGTPRDGRSVRAIQRHRARSQTSGGYASGIDAKTLPRLKNQSETENDSSASRSTVRIESGRRQSTRPSRKIAQNPSQIG